MGKKIVLGVMAAVAVAAVIVVVLVATQLDRFIKNQVETYGRAATGTEVRLRSVNVSLTESRGVLSGLTIGNPDGFDTPQAARIDEFQLQVARGSLRGDVLVVNEILADGAHLNVEQRGQATNLTEIQRHMDATRHQQVDPDQDGRIIIDRFKLTNARVTLTSDLLDQSQTLELGDVTVSGIGRQSGGASYEEATDAILRPILAAARSAVQARLRDRVREEVEEEARQRLRDLLDRN